MTEKQDFNEYQIKSIEKKVALDFDTELRSNNPQKQKLHLSVLKNIEVLIEDSLNQGIKYYKINFFEEICNLTTVSTEVEDTINFCMAKISMIEMMYLTIVSSEKKYGVFNVQCILATRTLTNGTILSSIKDIFNQLNDQIDIEYLDGYNIIRKTWGHLLEDKNYKFHRFVYFSKFHQNLYNSLAELEVTFFPECGYDLSFIDNALDSNIKGISGEKKSNEKICINLLNIFMHNNSLYLLEDKIYKKIEKSNYSYSFWDSVNYFDSNNLQILKNLKKKYSIQLKSLDIQDFLIDCWENVFETFLKKKINYFNNIVYYHDVIEFNDGLFYLNQNNFFIFEDYDLFFSKMKKFGCSKFFDIPFKKLQFSQPVNWLNFIKKSFFSKKQLNNFLLKLGIYFNSRVIKNRDIITILNNSKSSEYDLKVNISFLGLGEKRNKEDLFFFEQHEDKKLLVCENNISNSGIKNLYNAMDLKMRNHKLKNLGNLTFKFNENLSDKMLNDKTFLIRLLIYTFTFSCCEKNIEIETVIEQELAQIIIYCNNLFFSQIKNHEFLKISDL